jgi:hypothetical protein
VHGRAAWARDKDESRWSNGRASGIRLGLTRNLSESLRRQLVLQESGLSFKLVAAAGPPCPGRCRAAACLVGHSATPRRLVTTAQRLVVAGHGSSCLVTSGHGWYSRQVSAALKRCFCVPAR